MRDEDRVARVARGVVHFDGAEARIGQQREGNLLAPPRRSKRCTCEHAPLAERLRTPRIRVSGHLGEPVTKIPAPLGIAVACEVLPWRTHGISTTHLDHLCFRDVSIDTSTIYRDRSGNNSFGPVR